MADFGLQNVSFDNVDGWPSFLPDQSRRNASDEPSLQSSPPSDVTSDDDLLDRSGGRDPSSQPVALPLLQLPDWDEIEAYDEQPPTCIHYSIEWHVTYNKKRLPKDTEADLVLAPGAYWIKFFRAKLQKYVAKKLPCNANVHVEDTNITVIVRDRTVHNFIKSYDGLDIRWSEIEKQLQAWASYFQSGKALRLDITFNYVDTDPSNDDAPVVRKRGRKSATKVMLSQRARQIEAEEASGQPSIWVRIYQMMRCPGPPCHLGPHCWQDSATKKHYRMKSHHFRRLIKDIEEGHKVEKHDDMPKHLQDQIYAEEQQHLERKRKREPSPAGRLPPIQITNVLPGASTTLPRSPIELAGFRDVNVGAYTDWHYSQVNSEIPKTQFKLCGTRTLEEGYDLEQLHEEQNFQFLVDGGVKIGYAKRYIRDIPKWAKQYKG